MNTITTLVKLESPIAAGMPFIFVRSIAEIPGWDWPPRRIFFSQLRDRGARYHYTEIPEGDHDSPLQILLALLLDFVMPRGAGNNEYPLS